MKPARNPRTLLSSCEFKAGTLSSVTIAGNVSLTFAKLHSRLRHTNVRLGASTCGRTYRTTSPSEGA
eukprot:6758022-Prorocentrum_lima.AAC.1